MDRKPTYEELEQRVKELEKETVEQKRTAAVLRDSEENYRYLVENVNVGILVAQEMKLVFANTYIADTLGYTRDEIISNPNPFAFIYPDDQAMVIERHIKRIKGQEVQDRYPFRVVTAKGDVIWVEVTGVRVNWEGEPATLNFLMDITERKRIEEALKENHDTLNSILSASPIGIGLVENRVLKWANEAMMNMFGFESEADFKGKNTKMLYAVEDDYHSMGRTMYDRLTSGKPAVDDVIFKRKDGSNFIGHVKMSCQDPSNPMAKAIFTVSDISWRKQAEAERLEREKLEGILELAGAVCHELNQPLQSISGYSELLLMDMDDSHPLYARIAKIKQQVNRMGEITSKLMGIATYETKDYLSGKIIDIDKAAK